MILLTLYVILIFLIIASIKKEETAALFKHLKNFLKNLKIKNPELKQALINSIILSFIIIIISLFLEMFNIQNQYTSVKKDISNKDWSNAKIKLEKLGNYRNSKNLLTNVNYHYYLNLGDKTYNEGNYVLALEHYKNAYSANKKDLSLENRIIDVEVLAKKQELEENYKNMKKEQEKRLALLKKKIDKNAIYQLPTSYGKGYDRTLKRYGLSNIKKINQLMIDAALLVAENPQCVKVLDVDVSDERSTKDSIVIYVDCGDMEHFTNFERFYISESDIKNKKQPTSLSEQMKKNQGIYLDYCKAKIKQSLNYPSTFKSNTLLNQAIQVNGFTTTVSIDFKAKNAFNLETSHTGICRFNSKNQLVDFYI